MNIVPINELENNTDKSNVKDISLENTSHPVIITKFGRRKSETTAEVFFNYQRRKSSIPSYQRIDTTNDKKELYKQPELNNTANALVHAIRKRRRYMHISKQPFHRTTNRYMTLIDNGDSVLDYHETNNQFIMQTDDCINDHPYHPPGMQENPYKTDKLPAKLDMTFRYKNGVMIVANKCENILIQCDIDYKEFLRDYQTICKLVTDENLKSFCFMRLNFLNYRFKMHTLMNTWQEQAEQKLIAHRDFYNVRKVDNNIHATSSMNQKHLLKFIKQCAKQCTNDKVILDNATGKILTLEEVFKSLNLTPYELTVKKLDDYCEINVFHRSDGYNAKYNPVNSNHLREIFLKTDNYNNGQFFAHITKEVMRVLEESKYQSAELKLSIYGLKYSEWDTLAKWAVTHKVYSDNVKWMIQFPRIYDIFRTKKLISNFQEILKNIFTPLFEVTRDPSSHPELHALLNHISGFDSVDDESQHESCVMDKNTQLPSNWTSKDNPPYSYYLYYIYANLSVLNEMRSYRGFNIFHFRPHCGETGSVQNLVAGFLLGHNISHGLLLRKAPVLQYLYYLCQIGIAMSPLSNKSLFLNYQRNPLYDFLCRGLNVSLCTNDPLKFHFTKEPLMEEYSIAAQVWKLTSTDMCELARNSVMMSGFSDTVKSYWLGKQFKNEGVLGNDIHRTNVPNIRIAFRFETLTAELDLLLKMFSKV